jgi:hypothetical protein
MGSLLLQAQSPERHNNSMIAFRRQSSGLIHFNDRLGFESNPNSPQRTLFPVSWPDGYSDH